LIVKVVDASDPLKIQLLAGHKRPVRAASWSPDGNHIVSPTQAGVLGLDLGRSTEWNSTVRGLG